VDFSLPGRADRPRASRKGGTARYCISEWVCGGEDLPSGAPHLSALDCLDAWLLTANTQSMPLMKRMAKGGVGKPHQFSLRAWLNSDERRYVELEKLATEQPLQSSVRNLVD